MFLIRLENIHKIYKMGENSVKALRGVSLNILCGDFLSIVGASGSGKTTLMNIIGCLDIPTSGRYIFDGEDITRIPSKRLALLRNQKIGFIFQNFNLLRRRTALENVEMPLIFRGVDRSTRKRSAIAALERVGLSDRMTHKPSQLSGGQQQRVAIARAIVGNPAVILADEPTGNLDTASGQDILKLLISLNRNGSTIVLITHDPAIASYSNRRISLSDGCIIFES